jgi:hypothetical protein
MKKDTPLSDRLSTAAKARQAMMERARAKAPANDPEFAKRQEDRKAIAEARDVRTADRKAAKEAEAARLALERAAAEEARLVALKLEDERKVREREEQAEREVTLEVERKAARDARYAARKARRK